jgi:Outer membrane protein beta-barrel domain
MDERSANIDLAFRNGLKDYEVLPPPDVWNSIDSRIKRTVRPSYFIRAAAFLAIAMTMSVLAYRWAGRTAALQDNSTLAQNEQSKVSIPATKALTPVTQTKEIARSFSNFTAEPAQISTNDPAVTVEGTTDLSLIRMPDTNIQIPVKMTIFSIIHPQSDNTGTPSNKSFGATLTIDNLNKEYQDYIAEDNTAKNSDKWSISALASPTYYGKFSSGSDELSKQIMSSEKAVVSYSGGVALAYRLNKKFSIQSGLFYSSVGQEVNGIYSFAGFQKYVNTKGGPNFAVLTTNGTIYTTNADVFLLADGNSNRIITNYNNDVFDPQKVSLDYINNTMKQNFSYLELPVFLRYKVIDRTVDFNLIGGFSYNLLVDNSVYTVIDGTKYVIGTTGGMNMFSISSSVGMGMEYKFSEKLSLNLEPTFRYYINTFSTNSASNFHPYSFGIFSGLSYKF